MFLIAFGLGLGLGFLLALLLVWWSVSKHGWAGVFGNEDDGRQGSDTNA